MSLISVIMPSCNSAAYIEASIQSVLQQTHRELELIVVDDGSQDQTPMLLATLAREDLRLTVVQRPTCSGGPATPRNQALDIAKGDFVAFIDSDDLWHPQKLALQLKVMQTNNLDFVSSLHVPFTDSPPTEPLLPTQSEVVPVVNDHSQMIRKNRVVTSSALMKLSIIGDLRFDQSSQFIGVEDYLAWLYLHQQQGIRSAILQLPLVYYRLRRNSLSHSKVAMARKVFHLLSHYRFRKKSLGIKKYYYFTTYILYAIAARFKSAP